MYYISFITLLLLLKVSELGSHNMAATNQHLIFVFNRWLLVQIMHISKKKLHESIEEIKIVLDINVLRFGFSIFICL